MFKNEAEMQQWLEEKLESNSLLELIDNFEDFKDGKNYKNLESQYLHKSFEYCLENLGVTDVVFANKNISKEKGEGLNPDLILYSDETEALIVIELKNIKGPTRQAGTELIAYNCELRTYVPLLSNNDLIYIIVSNDWPTLLKHYIYHDVVWSNKKILCLEPFDKKGEICLRIIDLDNFIRVGSIEEISKISAYQLCLYESPKFQQDHEIIVPLMKASLLEMAKYGNSIHAHGFSFLWKDANYPHMSYAPYSITIFNSSTFSSLSFLEDLDPNSFEFKLYSKAKKSIGFGNAIFDITDACKSFIKNFTDADIEYLHDFNAHWDIICSRANPKISFCAWGIYGEEYKQFYLEKIREGMFYEYDDPELAVSFLESIFDI